MLTKIFQELNQSEQVGFKVILCKKLTVLSAIITKKFEEQKFIKKIKIVGEVGEAIIFAVDDEKIALDEYAKAQIKMLCDNEVSRKAKIRVMPDVHPAKVSTVGLTMTIGERILPNLVGIDIGCGVTMAKLEKFRPEFQKIDKIIRENISTENGLRKKIYPSAEDFNFEKIFAKFDKSKALKSLGTLGYGNHYIEIDADDEKNFYLSVHSGSRHLGKEITEFYLNEGQKILKNLGENIPYEMTYLTGDLMKNYLSDLKIVQEFALLNRKIILEEISKAMKWKIFEIFNCTHNYIDDEKILRKGAISAKNGEVVIIPVNMRDGVIFGKGKGNKDWNFSAPHGAGRILKRTEVKNNHTLSEFKAAMKGIYSTSINKDTLDESPFGYRKIDEILDSITETVEVEKILKPVYNFKAGNIEK